MFTVLSRLVDMVLGSVLEADEGCGGQAGDGAPDEGCGGQAGDGERDDYGLQTSGALRRDQDQPDVLLTLMGPRALPGGATEMRASGTVSQVFSGHGLIDGHIYFSDQTVHTDKPLRVGDKVSVVARQQFTNGGWTADSVTMVEGSERWWDEGGEEEAPVVPTGEVGRVTRFRDGEGFINGTIAFHLSACREGYRPCVGDWVSVELDTGDDPGDGDDKRGDDEDKQGAGNREDGNDDEGWSSSPRLTPPSQAARVSPVRERCFEGRVSAVMGDHGYVDGEVFFRRNVCVGGCWPRRGQVVRGGAVESSQGHCSWRAVFLAPTSRQTVRGRSPGGQNVAAKGEGFLVSGQRPQLGGRCHRLTIPRRLPPYPVPATLRQCVIAGQELTDFAVCLAQALTMENYNQRMDTLLFLEEIQMEMDIQEYSMQRVCLERTGEFLRLEVPGLAEGRPSVLVGDAVLLSAPLDPDQPRYEGIVHQLQSDAVLLKFNADFHCRYSGQDYDVTFTFNRTSFRRCHQAVQLAVRGLGEQVLFPREVRLKPPQVDLTARHQNGRDPDKGGTSPGSSPGITRGDHYVPGINRALQDAVPFFNPRLNERQKAAVIHVLLGQARPLPYIIFGPPGTGKTLTVVEAILQVLTRTRGSRIIACAPSNSAADLLAERLHDSGEVKMSDMVRLNAFSRLHDSIAPSIVGYCSTGEKLDVLCRFRVVIATCNTAGLLYTADLKAGHFTHAFIDEAGQATEPECLIPAGLVAGADGQVILAGDPHQLGPVLMSPLSKMYGLELSFLERLMDRLPYQHNNRQYHEHGGFQNTLVTMLVQNYRCHGAILQLPSELFYHGCLQECAPPAVTQALTSWPLLPRPGLPVVFHGVRSEDTREGDSPSWFNPGEVVEVVRYMQGLLGASPPVGPHDIGVITPYRKQVEKVRMLTERLGMPRVKVGSVEEFQGQERRAVIISTVRSNERLVRSDVRHVLGFLSNAKRFNVAITRAQALLVVIGNPHVLVLDEHWRQFVAMCVRQGSYTGCPLPDTMEITAVTHGVTHGHDTAVTNEHDTAVTHGHDTTVTHGHDTT